MNDKTIKIFLENLEANDTPKTLKMSEIENIISKFDNVKNLKKHLTTRSDSEMRNNLFHLLESTMDKPQITYFKGDRTKYLKKFKSGDEKEPFFYLLVTKDGDKTFITHLKTSKTNYLINELQSADRVNANSLAEFGWRDKNLLGGTSESYESATTKKNYNKESLDSSQNQTKNYSNDKQELADSNRLQKLENPQEPSKDKVSNRAEIESMKERVKEALKGIQSKNKPADKDFER